MLMSILLPIYKYTSEGIDNAFSQTYTNQDLLSIDNVSADYTTEINF